MEILLSLLLSRIYNVGKNLMRLAKYEERMLMSVAEGEGLPRQGVFAGKPQPVVQI